MLVIFGFYSIKSYFKANNIKGYVFEIKEN